MEPLTQEKIDELPIGECQARAVFLERRRREIDAELSLLLLRHWRLTFGYGIGDFIATKRGKRIGKVIEIVPGETYGGFGVKIQLVRRDSSLWLTDKTMVVSHRDDGPFYKIDNLKQFVDESGWLLRRK